jgi:hypothetical protein
MDIAPPKKKPKRRLDSIIIHFVRKHQAQPLRLGGPTRPRYHRWSVLSAFANKLSRIE